METTKSAYVIIKDIYGDGKEFHAIVYKSIAYDKPNKHVSEPDEKQTITNALNRLEHKSIDANSYFDKKNNMLVVKYDAAAYSISELVHDILINFGYENYRLCTAHKTSAANTIDDILSTIDSRKSLNEYTIENGM